MITKNESQIRTSTQNRALHLWFRLLAETLNNAGLDMRKVLKPEIEINWTEQSIKEYIWRPIQRVQFGKKSTTELTTKEIGQVYDTILRHLAKFGTTEPFPSIEEILIKQNEEK